MAPGFNRDRVASARAGAKLLERFHANAFAPIGHRRAGLNSRRSVPP